MSDENCPFKKYLSIFNLFLYEHGIPNQYFNMHVISPYTICIVEYLYCFYNLKKSLIHIKNLIMDFIFILQIKEAQPSLALLSSWSLLLSSQALRSSQEPKVFFVSKVRMKKKFFSKNVLSSPIMFFREIRIYLAGCWMLFGFKYMLFRD